MLDLKNNQTDEMKKKEEEKRNTSNSNNKQTAHYYSRLLNTTMQPTNLIDRSPGESLFRVGRCKFCGSDRKR